MMSAAWDVVRMNEALSLAEGSIGLSEPNPRVGCIIGNEQGVIFGTGATQAAGSAHAEVMAIRDARARGLSIAGATAWVTLEPCAHHGRTPPCCDALIEAGISRCSVAMKDPNPLVAGAGLGRMRAAGIQVDLMDEPAVLARARELNVGFFSRIERGRPWVRLKAAQSLDGRSALADGRSQWITGDEARADGHRWRKRASAILTGIGTVLADDPRLDVRAVPTVLQPIRIVLDSLLRIPANAALLRPPGEAWIIARPGNPDKAAQLRSSGARVHDDWPSPGMPELAALMTWLADQGVNELHVEAGPRLNGALLEADLVDELLIYQAPILVGPGRPMAELQGLQSLAAARRYEVFELQQLGHDLRVRLSNTVPASGRGAENSEAIHGQP
jgi:diaminohydroxyphosphoribosylaminopyrimidine deaminase / 5-amino-6-(5-phosphoribosylamino)uracil reductase